MPEGTSAAMPLVRLSEEALADYRRDGCLFLSSPWPRETMRLVSAWVAELAARPEVTGRHWVYRERSLDDPSRSLINRIENFVPFHAGLAALVDALAGPAGQLLGAEAVLFKDKVNFKMPGGDGFKPHQDSQAGWDVYAADFVSVAMAIDPATEANGCLQVVAGHHRQGLRDLWRPLSEAEMAGMTFRPYPMSPGDLMFFGSHTPHASQPNRSAEQRRMMFLTYNRVDAGDQRARYYADKHRGYPPDIDRVAGREYVFKV